MAPCPTRVGAEILNVTPDFASVLTRVSFVPAAL